MIDLTIRDFKVYSISLDDTVIYIGQTNNVGRRIKEHNVGLMNTVIGTGKQLYLYLKDKGIDTLFDKRINVSVIKEFTERIDAERWEAMMILIDYFKGNCLKQNVPVIKDVLSKRWK